MCKPVYQTSDLPNGEFHLSGISLSICDVGDSDLEAVSALQHLHRIYLDGTNVTDSGVLAWVDSFKSLKVLSLERTSVSDAVLPALSGIERIFVQATRMTPEGITEATPRYPKLSILYEGSQNAVRKAAPTAVPESGFSLKFGPRCQVKSKVHISSQKPSTIEARISYRAELSFSSLWTVGLISEVRTATPNAVHAVGIEATEMEQVALWALGAERGLTMAGSTPLRKDIGPDKPFHLAGVSDTTRLRTFVDGRLVSDVPIAPYEFEGPHDLLVGFSGVVTYPEFAQRDCSFRGSLDEVRISSVARYSSDFTPLAST